MISISSAFGAVKCCNEGRGDENLCNELLIYYIYLVKDFSSSASCLQLLMLIDFLFIFNPDYLLKDYRTVDLVMIGDSMFDWLYLQFDQILIDWQFLMNLNYFTNILYFYSIYQLKFYIELFIAHTILILKQILLLCMTHMM